MGSMRLDTDWAAKWEVVKNCDSRYDGVFFYAVKTTNIFCRPSCKSRQPKQSHVLFFQTADQARSEGFRPCKRCRPDDILWSGPHNQIMKKATDFIDANFNKRLTLAVISKTLAINPHYLHRIFKKELGKTPAEYLLDIRIQKAKFLLATTTQPSTDIAFEVGFNSLSHFSKVFKEKVGIPPTGYRQQHAGT